jgi:alpha-beta hydrolase superfamily lysophospholipase
LARRVEHSSLQYSRRAFIGQSALALVAGAATPGVEPAQGAESASARRSALPAIHAYEYWAKRRDISLYLYRKRLGSDQAAKSALPVLFLAHGSSVSSRPTFDLNVPGHDDYSLMDRFAAYGFDVWTMDFEGYGRSSKSAGNSNVADGVEDLKAASEVVLRETGQESFHLYGESGGALRAGVFAMTEPQRIRRLVLSAFTWTGKGSETLTKRAEDGEYYRTHDTRPRDRETARPRDRNMIRSIFTRDKPGTSDPAVAEAMADAELSLGSTVPTGTYVDMTTKLPLVDPTKLTMPVQIIRGEFDGIATEDDLLAFFQKLSTSDREFVVLPGAAHSVALGANRRQFWHVMRAFLDMPSRLELQR